MTANPPDPQLDQAEHTTLPTRQINQARQQAQYLKNKIMQAHRDGTLRKWGQLETEFGLGLAQLLPASSTITPAFLSAPIPLVSLEMVMSNYVNTTRERLLADAANTQDDLPRLKFRPAREDECYHFNAPLDSAFTHLLPEQQPVFNHIYNVFWNGLNLEPSQPPPRALLQNGKTGSGKTVVAVALIDKFIKEGRHLPSATRPMQVPFPILWLTVANAVEQTRRAIVRAGLGHLLGSVIHIISYNDLFTNLGGVRFLKIVKTTDPFDDNIIITSYEWMISAIPLFLILDEAHSVQNEEAQRTKAIQALDELERRACFPGPDGKPHPIFDMRALFLTATPVEKVMDLRMFVCMTNFRFQGTFVTYENFRTIFANVVANGTPDKVTKAATQRAYDHLRHRIIELPFVKWKNKAINDCRLYRFEDQVDRQFYDEAWERHCERCRMLGKDPDAGAVYQSLMIFAHEVEPIRAKYIIREMVANVQAGNTSVMAVRFTATIVKAVFILSDEYNVPRDMFSIVWGGRKNIKPDKILSQMDMFEIYKRTQQAGGLMSREDQRLIELNLAWQKMSLLFDDGGNLDRQAKRYERLRQLNLIGMQTRNRRQIEIDKFMVGKSRYCFFTADAGGTGLSLEHFHPNTAPREVWAGPIYNGKQFQQVMGRCPRRISASDTKQHVCLMDGTVESEHVAPILDRKLQAAGEFTSQKDDIAMILAGRKTLTASNTFRKAEELSGILRTREQILADAEDERSQIYSDKIEADDQDLVGALESDADSDDNDPTGELV